MDINLVQNYHSEWTKKAGRAMELCTISMPCARETGPEMVCISTPLCKQFDVECVAHHCLDKEMHSHTCQMGSLLLSLYNNMSIM